MPIEIFLNTSAKQAGPYQDRLSLEQLEDDIKVLLLKSGFRDFSIEDEYTGNSVTVTPNKARCKDIFIACLARLSSAQCEEVFQELRIEPGTSDFAEDYGRNKNVLLAEFKRALQEEEAREKDESSEQES